MYSSSNSSQQQRLGDHHLSGKGSSTVVTTTTITTTSITTVLSRMVVGQQVACECIRGHCSASSTSRACVGVRSTGGASSTAVEIDICTSYPTHRQKIECKLLFWLNSQISYIRCLCNIFQNCLSGAYC